MNLGELIAYLKRFDRNALMKIGLTNPHSYRGDYSCLAFAPAENITVGSSLDAALQADGAVFTGWKGGEYQMERHTDVYLVDTPGDTGEMIGKHFLTASITDELREKDDFEEDDSIKDVDDDEEYIRRVYDHPAPKKKAKLPDLIVHSNKENKILVAKHAIANEFNTANQSLPQLTRTEVMVSLPREGKYRLGVGDVGSERKYRLHFSERFEHMEQHYSELILVRYAVSSSKTSFTFASEWSEN